MSRQPIAKKGFRGFSLAEMAIVLVVIGLLLISFLPSVTLINSTKNRTETLLKLKNIETAIYNFAITNKRLPCPADGALTTGTELPLGGGTCANSQARGVVPWATLGLSSTDVQDNWHNQITFRIGYGLAVTAALDMSSCDPAGTAVTNPAAAGAPAINQGLCVTATCTGTFSAANCTSPQNFLLRKGLDVSDGTTKIMDYTAYTGAAFVLISHGDNGYGAWTSTQAYLPNAIANIAGTTLEAPNIDTALSVGSGAPPQIVDATFSDSDDATKYFDDLIIRPTLMFVISTAQLGPRSH